MQINFMPIPALDKAHTKSMILSSLLKGDHFVIQFSKESKKAKEGNVLNIANNRGQVLFISEVSVSIASRVVLLKGTSQTLECKINLFP